MRLRPQPPALLLSMKTKSGLWEIKEGGGGVHTLLSSTTCLLSFLYTHTEDKLMCLPFSFPTHKVRFILSDPPEHKNKEIQLLTASFSTLNSYALVYLPMDY